MKIFETLQQLDRRWIYLILAIAIIVPLTIPFNSETYTTRTTESLYRMIDSFSPQQEDGQFVSLEEYLNNDKAMLMSFLHDASTMPELYPMELAILRHCFERQIKVFTLTFLATGAPIMDMAINTVKEEIAKDRVKKGLPPLDIQSGTQYINFGYKVYQLQLPIVLGMGEDISEAVDIDAEGRKISSLPIMKNIKNYNNMNLVTEFSGSVAGSTWYYYARPRFGVNVGVGVTAVMAADEYPLLQTGQLIGLLAGLKGAAEYEKLVDIFAAKQKEFSKDYMLKSREAKIDIADSSIPYNFKQARIGMNAQSVAHILIIVFILIGNIGYFIQKYEQRKEGK